MRKTVLAVVVALALSLISVSHSQSAAQNQKESSPDVHGPTIPPLKNVNPEVLRLVVEDQWDRGNDMFGKGQVKPPSTIDWKIVDQHDIVRHQAIRDLLAAGKLTTASDFSFAGLIFQHSGDPADLMLAHLLSTNSVLMGGNDKWMMAATLDRYLHSLKQPQIFGTQFFTPDGGHTWTMEPYNRTTLTDAERALWCVVPLAEQQRILEQHQMGQGNFSTGIPGCK